MAKEIKIEWCKNYIASAFLKHHAFKDNPEAGYEINCFWKMAENAGLYIKGTYGSPMSFALDEMCNVEIISDDDGNYLYTAFKLKPEIRANYQTT